MNRTAKEEAMWVGYNKFGDMKKLMDKLDWTVLCKYREFILDKAITQARKGYVKCFCKGKIYCEHCAGKLADFADDLLKGYVKIEDVEKIADDFIGSLRYSIIFHRLKKSDFKDELIADIRTFENKLKSKLKR